MTQRPPTADRSATEREAGHPLPRLAAMATLREWVRRTTPVLMHEAVLAGESPAEVAAAARLTLAEAHLTWHAWATRRLAPPARVDGVSLHQYLRVHTAFADALNTAAANSPRIQDAPSV
ncbi:MAG TPA: hypothetical protein VG674_12880 [Amycolatopsis sp.]|nr:hypothetical protein [Amycolatopsis sp.]